jgi:hypothetical protein
MARRNNAISLIPARAAVLNAGADLVGFIPLFDRCSFS